MEDYNERGQAFIDKLPNLMIKVLVVTVKGGETKVLKNDPFLKIIQYGYERFSFSEARNYALHHCNSKWIISLDLDEEIHFSDDDLNKVLEAPENVGGFYSQIVNFDSRDGWLRNHQAVRIFRRGYEWRYHVHEDISLSILEDRYIAESSIIIRHFGYDNINSEKYYSKLKRNYWLCARDCYERPDDDYVRNNMNRITNDMKRYDKPNRS